MEKGIDYYTSRIEENQNDKQAYYDRGNVYCNQKEYEKAIEDYNRAIEIDPNYTAAYNNRGIAYYYKREYEEAIKDYTKAIELDPKYVVAYNRRGVAYKDQGEYEKAIKEYGKAIEINSRYEPAYNNRGIAYRAQGKHEKAIKEYEKAIEINPKYAIAYYNRGNFYKDQGEYEKAIKDYTETIEIDSRYAIAYNNRGAAYEAQKEYGKAIKDYTEAIKLIPNYMLAIKNKDRANFYNYIFTANFTDDQKEELYKLHSKVIELKNKLKYDQDKNIGHYTKVNNLKYLIKPNKENDKGLLRLNNVAYMNDPTEGEVFIKLLKNFEGEDTTGIENIVDNLYNRQNSNKREVLSGKNNVFLVSFSNAIDTSLPMWVQYAEDGKGCCLVFNSEFFDNEDNNIIAYELNEDLSNGDEAYNINSITEENHYCLYQVKYVVNEGDDNYNINDEEINKLLSDIAKKLIEFKDDIEKDDTMDNQPSIKVIIKNTLDQIRFLFKDKNYEHEKEVRLVKFENNGNVKYTTDVEGFRVPHVYINMEKELDLEEVVLGPKVEQVSEIANYLYYTEKVKRVSKSKIKYQ